MDNMALERLAAVIVGKIAVDSDEKFKITALYAVPDGGAGPDVTVVMAGEGGVIRLDLLSALRDGTYAVYVDEASADAAIKAAGE